MSDNTTYVVSNESTPEHRETIEFIFPWIETLILLAALTMRKSPTDLSLSQIKDYLAHNSIHFTFTKGTVATKEWNLTGPEEDGWSKRSQYDPDQFTLMLNFQGGFKALFIGLLTDRKELLNKIQEACNMANALKITNNDITNLWQSQKVPGELQYEETK